MKYQLDLESSWSDQVDLKNLESDQLKVENLGSGSYFSGIEISEKFCFVIWGEIHRTNQLA